MQFDLNNPRTLATTAIMTALVLGLTMIHIAQTPIGGYIHLGDAAIFFTALAFGPWAGLVVGGLGTALADVIGGYAIFAPLTFIVHGAQGFIVGWIAGEQRTTVRVVLATLAGSLVLVAGYFAGESLIPTFGGPAYALTEVPWNFVQEIVGTTGVLAYFAVARAYPRIRHAS
jgi:uncharacterized membrane protein